MRSFHDDTTLCNLLSKDEVRAFDALYYKYYTAVFANIRKIVQQQEAAEDILQDVFAALWENRRKLDPQRPVGGWLFVVSYNKSIKFLRMSVQKKMMPLGERSPEPSEVPDSGEDVVEYQAHLINSAIESLPPAKRRVFILCKLEGKSYEEAARLTGISRNTVKEYVSSSLKSIKAYALRQHALDSPLSLSVILTIIDFMIT